MSRRSTPERLYQAGNAGTLTRLIGEGELPARQCRHTSRATSATRSREDRMKVPNVGRSGIGLLAFAILGPRPGGRPDGS
jgi:hypothetical protein